MQHQLPRKKSGELARPALRGSSGWSSCATRAALPSPKTVRFHQNLGQVRRFSQVDQPIAISAETVETEDIECPRNDRAKSCKKWGAIATNSPRDSAERQHLLVRVRGFDLSQDRWELFGTVIVANLAFEKHVTVRFTFDNWQTISEVQAEYRSKLQDEYDVFEFAIRLPDQDSLQSKTLLLCVRYQVSGQEYWDNNSGENFQVIFRQNPETPGRRVSFELPGQCHRITRLSDRYNFSNSFELFWDAQDTARERNKCGGLELGRLIVSKRPKSWVTQNPSITTLTSAAYIDLIRKFCFFEPSSTSWTLDHKDNDIRLSAALETKLQKEQAICLEQSA